jgi:hypothetical protein
MISVVCSREGTAGRFAPEQEGDEEGQGQEDVEAQRRGLVPVQHVVDPLAGGAVVDEHEHQVH